MTLWPGTPVPVPKLRVPQARMLASDIIVFGREPDGPDEATQEIRLVELPAEFYVREFMALDASKAEAAEAFCRLYGPVGRMGLTDLPPNQSFDARRPEGRCFLPEPWRSLELAEMRMGAAGDVEMRGRVLQPFRATLALAQQAGLTEFTDFHPLSQAGLYQDVLHDMICIWRYFSEDWGEERLALELRVFVTVEGHTSDATRAAQLAEGLNRALTPFTVRLEERTAADEGVSTSEVNVYQAMCLQLANHIAENAAYHRCANEPCGRLFVRQRGGAKFGQYHTSSVLYCSPQCARAQAARVLRRRKRAADEAKRAGADPPREEES